MSKLLNEIIELYLLGGDLQEILKCAKELLDA